jgi:ABC-type transport system involved in multi-copper enzyme maturation permease subunit
MNVPRKPMLALFWKEWRSLRALRWACMGLAAMTPLFFIAGLAISRQGLLHLPRVTGWTMKEFLHDALPGSYALVLWPLASLLMATQCFAGDRSAGTETFLLERPVPRWKFWIPRLLASVCSALSIAAVSVALWAACIPLSGGLRAQEWKGPQSVFITGLVIIAVTTICGMASGSLIASPLLAILGSAVFIALPAGLSVGLAAVFPHATLAGMPIPALAPWLLVPFYFVVSYVASCVGEPAGRGRAGRGLGALGLGVLAALFVFMSFVQALQRWESGNPLGSLMPSPRGDRALVSYGFGAEGVWLMDTKAAKILGYYPRPCYEAIWRKDGGMFAILTSSGPLGSEGRLRISFFDRDGTPTATPWYASSDEVTFRLAWNGGWVVFSRMSYPKASLDFFEPGKGVTGSVEVPFETTSWAYVGSLWDGSAGIVKLLPGEKEGRSAPGQEPVRKAYGLYRVSPSNGTIDPTPLIVEKGFLLRSQSLSPSGRWWKRDRPRAEPQEMVDLETGQVVPATKGGWPDDPVRFWLQEEGDATGLVEDRSSGTRTLRSWSHAQVQLRRSPDNRFLLVGAMPFPNPQQGEERWIYEIETGSWESLSVPRELIDMAHDPHESYDASWAGPETLAWTTSQALAFEDLDAPGKLRYVSGGP